MKTYDLVGIGNAVVDVISHSDDAFLDDMGIEKGIMQLIEQDRAEQLYRAMGDRLQTPGGAVANTIAGVGALGLQTAFIGRVRDLRDGTVGKLRILATPPLGHSVVPGALSDFLRGREGVTVQYDVRRMENVIDGVVTGAADIGLCLGLETCPGLAVKIVSHDPMVAMMRPDHPLAKLDVIRPGDIEAHGFIGLDRASKLGLLVQNAFDLERTPYMPQVEVRYCHTAAVLAQSGNKVAIVDRFTSGFMPNMALVARPFAPAISVSACVLSRPNRPVHRLADEFEAVFIKTLNS